MPFNRVTIERAQLVTHCHRLQKTGKKNALNIVRHAPNEELSLLFALGAWLACVSWSIRHPFILYLVVGKCERMLL